MDSLGDDADIGFADPMLFSQITALRHRVDSILFITNDYKLGEDVQRHTEPDSGKICVCQINRYGHPDGAYQGVARLYWTTEQ